MKSQFFATDKTTGERSRWAFERVNAVNCTLGRKPRKVSGWELTTDDGCVRFCEGAWIDFVPFAGQIAGNYNATIPIS